MAERLSERTWADFRSHWHATLGFHLTMQALGLAIFTPVVTWLGRRIVSASGDAVISNFDIAKFVLSPPGATFVLVVAALSVSLLLAQFTGLTWIAGHAVVRRPVSVSSTIAFVLRKLPALVVLATRVFVRLVLLALPFLGIAAVVGYTQLAGHDINYYLAENPPEWRWAKLIAALLAAGYGFAVVRQLARWVFAVPALAFEAASPHEALRRSEAMAQGRLVRTVAVLVAWWALLLAVTFVITWLCRQVSDAGLDWAGIDVHRVLPLVALYMTVAVAGGFLVGAIGLAGHQFLVTRMYGEHAAPERLRAAAEAAPDERSSRSLARPVVIGILALLAIGLGLASFLLSRLDLTEDVDITAHRGASVAAPENSMAAFRAAMEAGSTYAELDVQHTRDRVLVVVHDGDLLRMGGDPRKVGELTAAEIAKIDIGRKAGPQFAGEAPPTLEQVIGLARGRMKLNIELKYNVPDPGLAPAVVDLLRREGFIDQAVITSLDYAALKQVKTLEPRLRTGHIVTAAVGNVVRSEADFLSLNAARATPSLLRNAHAAGKQVHVWTVNTPEGMLRMIERGVDNIITDDPALLAKVMRERNALDTPQILGLRLRVLFSEPPREVKDPEAVRAL
jgi:glycerophosphoryl diester phosphodiesterase